MREKIREISFEQISEGIFVTDYEGRLIDANITAKNIFSFLNNFSIFLQHPPYLLALGSQNIILSSSLDV